MVLKSLKTPLRTIKMAPNVIKVWPQWLRWGNFRWYLQFCPILKKMYKITCLNFSLYEYFTSVFNFCRICEESYLFCSIVWEWNQIENTLWDYPNFKKTIYCFWPPGFKLISKSLLYILFLQFKTCVCGMTHESDLNGLGKCAQLACFSLNEPG